MYDKSGATWKTMQGCYPEDEHDENMHFSTPPIHYSGSHWALTYQKKKTTGNWQQEVADEKCPVSRFISASTLCTRVGYFTASLRRVCRPQMTHRLKIRAHKKASEAPAPVRNKKKKRKKELLSSRLMIRLIIHVAHPWVTWHNMRNDECRSSSTVSAVAWI